MNNSTWISIVIVVIVVLGAGWYFYATQGTTPAPAQTNTTTGTVEGTVQNTPAVTTVLYGPQGFSPSTVTIKVGDTVTFTNNGGGQMWVTSNPHPTHTGYDGTSRTEHCATGYAGPVPFDECAAGVTYSFKFDKAGSWGYHNHLNDSASGTIVVQ